MKLFLIYSCICLVWHQAQSVSIDRKCEDGHSDCFDLDYRAEDAARDEILNNGQGVSSNTWTKSIPPDTNYKTNEDMAGIWKNWLEEWPQLERESAWRNPQEDSELLCLTERRVKKFAVCNQISSKDYACIKPGNGTVDLCESYEDTEFRIPLCKEKSSEYLVSCGKYSKTFLCYPSPEEEIPVRPCRQRNRQICLSSNGSLSRCISRLFLTGEETVNKEKQFEQFKEWKDLMKVWDSVIRSANQNNLSKEAEPLCKTENSSNTFTKCKDDTGGNKACVSPITGQVADCKSYNETGMLVPICTEHSSNKVISCRKNTSALLCFQRIRESTAIIPCNSDLRSICLTSNGLLRKCSEENSLKFRAASSRFTEPVKKDYTKETEGIQKQIYNVRSLCKEDKSNTVFRCNENSAHSVACLNTRNGKIEACEIIERNAKIGIPVCIQEHTSELVTCGKFSQGNLCFSRENETNPIIPCKRKSRSVCVTAQGSFKKCEMMEDNERYKEDEASEDVKRLLNEAFQRQLENVTNLCKSKEGLTECSNVQTDNFACLNSRNGKIDACNSQTPNEFSIPVCVQGSTKSVVTCGVFNKVNLCFSPNKTGSVYIPCNFEKRFVCFIHKTIQKCFNGMIYFRRDESRNSLTKISRESKRADKDTSTYHNSDKVHKFVENIMKSIVKNCRRLCNPEKSLFMPCENDPSNTFACLDVVEGVMKPCSKFHERKFAIPICVEPSNTVLAYGEFFKANLCFRSSGKTAKIEVCDKRNQNICLSKDGILKKCKEDEVEKPGEKKEKKEEEGIPEKESEDTADQKEEGREEYATVWCKPEMEEDEEATEDQGEEEEGPDEKEGDEDEEGEVKEGQDKEGQDEDGEDEKEVQEGSQTEEEENEAVTDGEVGGTEKENEEFSEGQGERAEERDKNGSQTQEGKYEMLTDDQGGTEKKRDTKGKRKGKAKYVEPEEYKDIIKNQNTIIILCKPEKKLVNCDDDPSKNFACARNKTGEIKTCHPFEKQDAISICTVEQNKLLFSCTIGSEIPFCLPNGNKTSSLIPCNDSKRFACLGNDGVPVKCDSIRTEVAFTDGVIPEKFFRFHCNNCSIENRFIIDGTPDDVLPEQEVISFKTE